MQINRSIEISSAHKSIFIHLLNFIEMQKRRVTIFIIDLFILTGSFLLVALYKPSTARYLSDDYLFAFGALMAVWAVSSFYFRKYNFKKRHSVERLVRIILLSNFVSMSVILLFITMFGVHGYSRLMLFGTTAVATLFELVSGNLYFLLIRTKTEGYNTINPPASDWEIESALAAKTFRELTLCSDAVREAVLEECGEGIYSFMCKHLDASCDRTLLLSTGSRFNLEMQPERHYGAVVNMKRVNDIRYINKFFESVNRKLPKGGTFIGCAETKDLRKKRILGKYPAGLNWLFYSFDYLIKRVFPKFLLTKKIYYLLTRGQNRVISRAELMGRLYSCGFAVSDAGFVNGLYCFCVKKVTAPVYDFSPTFGPFIKLSRVGMGGDIIRVYKLRTMHPYAEYLQKYVFENNNLDKGGKYRDDFRVTTIGKIMRSLWIDELPMFFNLLKGQVKLVGVRPLSRHYLSLYDKDIQERRVRYKPGLVPPFYFDLPQTLREIQDSEIKYLDEYDRSPFITDFRYLCRAAVNIIFKRARSK